MPLPQHLKPLVVTLAVGLLSVVQACGGTATWQEVLQPYTAIETLSCEVRRDAPLPQGGTARMLSRVYFQRGDRMHVETTTPIPRRIVCDGTNFQSHIEGMPRGFGTTVAKLPAEMLANLRAVPGSPAQALWQLADAAEQELEAPPPFARRIGYDNGQTFTCLSLDEAGRLLRLEIFETPEMDELIARTDYSAYLEVAPGVWLARIQKSMVRQQGKERTETLRLSNLIVNQQLPPMLFNPAAHFKEIEFVDSLDKIAPAR